MLFHSYLSNFNKLSPTIVLASQSPNRLAILKMIGFRPLVHVSNFEENLPKDLPVREYVELTAQGKMDEILEDFKKANRHFDVLIAADTMVCSGEKIYGKPIDENDAVETLKLLRGKAHTIYSGVVIAYQNGPQQRFSTETKVWMGNYSDQAILDYVATKEPMNKAGSYGIQNRAGALIEKIEGCHFNVAGLPIGDLALHLAKRGFRPFGLDDVITPSSEISNPSSRAGKIILADQSADRLTLLRKIGIEPVIKTPIFIENISKEEEPKKFVQKMAQEKMKSVEKQMKEEKEEFDVIIAAETTLLVDGKIVEKPKDKSDAIETLKKLRDGSHSCLTGVSMKFNDGTNETFTVETKIHFTQLSNEIIEAYVNAEDVMDRAGSYAMQTRGAIFVQSVDGCYSNAIGLPVYEIAHRLHLRGHRLWDF
ncbi:unnamed protein product, partial [Mesorhabditis belari]|uniref:Uncharacterized protein n=1 Tax=Mesorhabditis belari TaxID=2138241 RepID=A0AAF3EK12_9BILA